MKRLVIRKVNTVVCAGDELKGSLSSHELDQRGNRQAQEWRFRHPVGTLMSIAQTQARGSESRDGSARQPNSVPIQPRLQAGPYRAPVEAPMGAEIFFNRLHQIVLPNRSDWLIGLLRPVQTRTGRARAPSDGSPTTGWSEAETIRYYEKEGLIEGYRALISRRTELL